MLAAANFENVTVEEKLDENVFLDFMKKITIWEYFGITKAHYLTLPYEKKKEKISRYYSDINSRKIGGKLFVFFVLFYLKKCLLKG